jgi:hypothetical protein
MSQLRQNSFLRHLQSGTAGLRAGPLVGNAEGIAARNMQVSGLERSDRNKGTELLRDSRVAGSFFGCFRFAESPQNDKLPARKRCSSRRAASCTVIGFVPR